MGMCCCVFCCPLVYAGSSACASIPTCCFPKAPLSIAWIFVTVCVLLIGLAVYADLTVKCQSETSVWLGTEPVPGTGVWVENTSRIGVGVRVWFPRPGEGHDGELLVNYTARDLGFSENFGWSPSPLDYQSTPCWSDGAGAHALQGVIAGCVMAVGFGMCTVSILTKLSKITFGECCGKEFEPEEVDDADEEAAEEKDITQIFGQRTMSRTTSRMSRQMTGTMSGMDSSRSVGIAKTTSFAPPEEIVEVGENAERWS